ncbi:hypothetical protein PGSY75_0719000 [Plasmodium gaboni]|uniref:Uncharacterized protein n=1 Tax=Plasmodium gaboni TaxID=647221 RepID=A0A151LQ71_9APIC|nr:hypothetical protein PGSY75_0719000 [Plasmodium gaboni]KYO01328.1 hypothetical protein PGSY75_0719000 [Plasmodium gaboni]SOV12956.1 conserved Plasmodium protein, unknown function [Plasmodium gaboni]SOV21975.1 conserved Plasmodium protein, unknown function [Plasmodium sp. DRC-Itaito]
MVDIKLKSANSSCEFKLDFNEIKLPDDINILKDLEKEVENSIYHLKRSNEEIKEYDPQGLDKDLFLALNENKFALFRKEERLMLIRKKIQNIENTHGLADTLKVSQNNVVDNKEQENIKDDNIINNTIDDHNKAQNDKDINSSNMEKKDGIYL